MDLECFVEVIAKHLTPEQMEAILDDFSRVDPQDYCLVCSTKAVPVDEQGRIVGEDNMDDFDRYEYHHKEGCPVQFLINQQAEASAQ